MKSLQEAGLNKLYAIENGKIRMKSGSLEMTAYYMARSRGMYLGDWFTGLIVCVLVCIAAICYFSDVFKSTFWIIACSLLLVGTFASIYIVMFRLASSAWRGELARDVFFHRAKMIVEAEKAYCRYFEYYSRWYDAIQRGAPVDERQAGRYLDFLAKAEHCILLAQANYRLAKSRVDADNATFEREKLVELMGILNQPSYDPMTELADAELNQDNGLQSAIEGLLSLPLSPEYVG